MNSSTKKVKASIVDSLRSFQKGSLRQNAMTLFNTLGYSSDKTIDMAPNSAENFLETFDSGNIFRKDKTHLKNWQSFDIIFQLTDEEISGRGNGKTPLPFDTHKKIDNKIIESYLFVALQLKKGHYTRTDLSTITREINKLFPMPVLVLFKSGDTLTFAIIDRRLNKMDSSRDVLEKVTLIKDIRFTRPHRAHIEILYDLSFNLLYKRYSFSSFVGLHDAWRKSLDSEELNKKFYRELANWYFWAMQNVTFPKDAGDNADLRNATSLIRLITRLIFIWFIKEMGLVPDKLFNENKLSTILEFNDPNQSTYYKAILQNLFFATLNQEMNTTAKPDNRKFRHRSKKATGRDQHYMIHNVYRYERYFKNPDEALNLFSTIPFLNGGLFECLDKPDSSNSKNILRIDGFSDRTDNELVVPDFLFFSEEREVDLNKSYGTKNKRYKVKGLLRIFKRYKFTIDENTPIEEEVALDPELLGKAFENLLAAYNPETGVTARKQTGSFYTPREIVNYMVDESLKASLSNLVAKKLANTSEEDIKTGMDILFAYTEKDHAFNDEEVLKIVETVSELKILDPACGSGAFPMGVLHKLVYILGKLDPDNTRWRELQKLRAIRETEEAYNVGDKNERHRRLVEIENTFNLNTSNYGRKLYLIENCIYGIDIQPIAVQIAKLRFFISLVVDQKVDKKKDNLGIRPLPNLETKFVAANTLIGIDKGVVYHEQISIDDAAIRKLKNTLVKIRHKYFNARTFQTKKKLREKDKQIRERIRQKLLILYEKELKFRISNSPEQKELEHYQLMIEKFEYSHVKKTKYEKEKENVLERINKIKRHFTIQTNKVAQQLADWNPYNQNTSAGFFNMEWMFGLKDGFDIVIGNPPYGVKFSPEEKKLYNSLFKHQNYQLDSYLLFLEKGVELAVTGAGITYIIPNPWLTNLKLKKIRKYISSDLTILEIKHYMRKVFDAVVDTEVVLLKKSKPNNNTLKIIIHQDKDKFYSRAIPQKKWQLLNGEPINIFLTKQTEELIEIIKKNTSLLGNIYNVTVGMKPYQNGKGTPKQTKKIVKNRVFDATYKKGTSYRPLLRGKDIEKFVVKWGGDKWINYGCWLAEPRYSANFDAKEKIVLRQTGDSLIATLDTNQFICMNNLHVIHPKSNEFDLKYVLGLINSNVLTFYYHSLNPEMGEARAEVKKENVEKLLIKDASDNKKDEIIFLVNKVLTIKKLNSSTDTTALEAEIDAHVAHLYNLTEKEYKIILKETNCPEPFRVAALNTYRDIVRK